MDILTCETRNPNLHQKYSIRGVLGNGSFSTVRLAIDWETEQSWACKIISKQRHGHQLPQSMTSSLLREVQILQRLQHPNVIQCRECFEDSTSISIIMEYANAGNLQDEVTRWNPIEYYEAIAQYIYRQIVDAVKYLHENGVAHRDLKPENALILNRPGIPLQVKLSDFGLSHSFDPHTKLMNTVCGTPSYLAPEVALARATAIPTEYTMAVDMWSLGVLLYFILVGEVPFMPDHSKQQTVEHAIIKCEYNQLHPRFQGLSDECKDLIRRHFVVNPKMRITAEAASQHPWVT
ncbi:kinase-like protein, partial [Ramicandelaber brevisporus]